MSNAQKIRMALAYTRISEAELARRFGTSPQSFNNRMKTDKFTADEMNRIAKALGASFEVAFVFPDGMRV